MNALRKETRDILIQFHKEPKYKGVNNGDTIPRYVLLHSFIYLFIDLFMYLSLVTNVIK